ncbi:MAG: hypothetical protein ACK559_24195, partial [bacterium]
MPREIDRLCDLIEKEYPTNNTNKEDNIQTTTKCSNYECEVCKEILPNYDIFEFHVCQHCD